MLGSSADLVGQRVVVEGEGQPARGEGEAHERPAHLAHLVRVRVRVGVGGLGLRLGLGLGLGLGLDLGLGLRLGQRISRTAAAS